MTLPSDVVRKLQGLSSPRTLPPRSRGRGNEDVVEALVERVEEQELGDFVRCSPRT